MNPFKRSHVRKSISSSSLSSTNFTDSIPLPKPLGSDEVPAVPPIPRKHRTLSRLLEPRKHIYDPYAKPLSDDENQLSPNPGADHHARVYRTPAPNEANLNCLRKPRKRLQARDSKRECGRREKCATPVLGNEIGKVIEGDGTGKLAEGDGFARLTRCVRGAEIAAVRAAATLAEVRLERGGSDGGREKVDAAYDHVLEVAERTREALRVLGVVPNMLGEKR